MERKNFTEKQLDVLGLLMKHYPQGIGTDDPEIRRVADSIIARGSGLVELIDNDQTPTGDCYRLTTPEPRRFARTRSCERERPRATDEAPRP